MADFDNKWLSRVVARLRAGESYTRELVAACYYAAKSPGSNESGKVSEGWIDELWEKSKNIPREEFLAVRWWTYKKRGKLLHKILT